LRFVDEAEIRDRDNRWRLQTKTAAARSYWLVPA
jgi:hypothetical protein